MINTLTTIFLAASVGAVPIEHPVVSTINGHELPHVETGQSYSFWVAAHLYGSHGNRTSIFPASSFIANLDQLSSSDAKLLMLVGDSVRRPDEAQLDQLQRLMLRLPFPVFNAPGNHDRPESEQYQRRFGQQTYLHFRMGPSLFIVLDTDLDGGRISGQQLQDFLTWLRQAEHDDEIRHVFVFSHDLIWCTDHPVLSSIRANINSTKHLHRDWFARDLQPVLDRLAEQKPVYWLSGDIGATWSYSTFYWKDPQRPLHYLATGLGDTSRDAILRIEIDEQAQVLIEPVSLTGQKMLSIESYGLHFWEDYFQQRKTQALAQKQKNQQAATSQSPPSTPWSLTGSLLPKLLLGLALAWLAYRLIETGWQRFRPMRKKY